MAAEGVELYLRPGRMIVASPTNDGQVLTIVLWPIGEFRQVRSDIEGNFLAVVELAPALAERTQRHAERLLPWHEPAPQPLSPPLRRRRALVGDAGYHKDPILALGITDAFRDAELLADAVNAGLSGRRPLASALPAYEHRRNELAGPGFESTIEFARLEPPRPEMQELLAALLHDQEGTNRFFGTFAGTVPSSEFFAAENLAQIMGGHAEVGSALSAAVG